MTYTTPIKHTPNCLTEIYVFIMTSYTEYTKKKEVQKKKKCKKGKKNAANY